MIVTYNWLKEFVDFDLSPEELGHLLTMLGLEVEGLRRTGEGLDEVVVAYVEERRQHPDADKLSLCTVFDGSERLEVVCGAPNVHTGATVALARIGATLPGNFKIKRSKIRGVESCGMICSEKELGLSEEAEGIWLLPAGLPLGEPVFAALGLKDTVYEIGLTPNRADCLSVVGVAREIAAKLGTKVTYPELRVPETGPPIDQVAQVTIDDPDLCPRYAARYLAGCTVGPSPAWLVRRLEAVGMRSINNVVDVTNYVLMEYGHPLHAFDFDLLAGGKIVVRRAGEGETFTSLDGQERLLTARDLTIRDGERAVALAGIMGGGNSEISAATTNILLESAYFDPSAIRRTSKRLGLHTESSHRFERGADIVVLTRALDRAAALIAELAGGTVASGTLDVYPRKLATRTVRARVERINAILGFHLQPEEIRRIFENLEFAVADDGPGVFRVEIPSFRVDIEREIDLVEEVVRLHGYDQVPVTMPLARVISDRPPKHQRLERQAKDLLVGLGFSEVVTFSFIAPDAGDRILLPADDPRRAAVKLLNPLVEEQSVLRTSLLPGLLEVCSRNASFRVLNQQIFEMRRVYLPKPERELPEEPVIIAGLLTGQRHPEGWNQDKAPLDFYDAKGVVETIIAELRVPDVTWEARDIEPYFHPGKACSLFLKGHPLGALGELHPAIQANFELPNPVYYFELNFEKLAAHNREISGVTPPSRFPDTFRDVAMLAAVDTPAEAIVRFVRELRVPNLTGIDIFDLYTGEHVPAGQKSLAIRVRYGASDRTLTDEEVGRFHQRVVDGLLAKMSVTIR